MRGIFLILLGIIFILGSLSVLQVIPPQEYLQPYAFVGVLTRPPVREYYIYYENYYKPTKLYDTYIVMFPCKNWNPDYPATVYINKEPIETFNYYTEDRQYIVAVRQFRSDRPLEIAIYDESTGEKIIYYLNPYFHTIRFGYYNFVNPMISATYGTISPNLENADITLITPSNVEIQLMRDNYGRLGRYFVFTENEGWVGFQINVRQSKVSLKRAKYGFPVLPYDGVGTVENLKIKIDTQNKEFSLEGRWIIENEFGRGRMYMKLSIEDKAWINMRYLENLVLYGFNDIGQAIVCWEENLRGTVWLLAYFVTATIIDEWSPTLIQTESIWDVLWWWITDKPFYFSMFIVGCSMMLIGYMVERTERYLKVRR